MALNGEKGSDACQELAEKAAELQKHVSSVNAEIKSTGNLTDDSIEGAIASG